MLMCKKHWFMVSTETRAEVWKHYRPGQCDDKRPSREWHGAADKAIKEVSEKEQKKRQRRFKQHVKAGSLAARCPDCKEDTKDCLC
jgi:hypothetical protein